MAQIMTLEGLDNGLEGRKKIRLKLPRPPWLPKLPKPRKPPKPRRLRKLPRPPWLPKLPKPPKPRKLRRLRTPPKPLVLGAKKVVGNKVFQWKLTKSGHKWVYIGTSKKLVRPVRVRWMSKTVAKPGKKVRRIKLNPTKKRIRGFLTLAAKNIMARGASRQIHASVQAKLLTRKATLAGKRAAYRKAAIINVGAEIERTKKKIRSTPMGIGRLKLYKTLKDRENLGRKLVVLHNAAKLDAIRQEGAASLLREATQEPDDTKRVSLMAAASLAREIPVPIKVPPLKKKKIPGVVSIRALYISKFYLGRKIKGVRPEISRVTAPEIPEADERRRRGRWEERQYIAAGHPMHGFEGFDDEVFLAGAEDDEMEVLLGEFGDFEAFDNLEGWMGDIIGKAWDATKWGAKKLVGAFKKGKKKADAQAPRVTASVVPAVIGKAVRPVSPRLRRRPPAAPVPPPPPGAPPPVGMGKYLLPAAVAAGAIGLVMATRKK